MEYFSPGTLIQEPSYEPRFTLDSVLYPERNPYNEGYLEVGDNHSLWFAEYGNPSGVPVVVLHGGPGGGCSAYDSRFFDPEYYHIVLFDQRGSGHSAPLGSIENNNTEQLINDVEKVRQSLNIDKWMVFGGSWGSALSMLYGEAYPDRCLAFVLRGIFLGNQAEYLQVWNGMGDIYPDVFNEYINNIPKEEQNDLITAFYSRLMNDDADISLPAAKAFLKYDLTCSFLNIDQEIFGKIFNDESKVLAFAKIFAHFSRNAFFLSDNTIINNIYKVQHLPAIIVHGRYDAVCRVASAYSLQKEWQNSQLIIVPDAGHASIEVGNAKALVAATDFMKSIIQ